MHQLVSLAAYGVTSGRAQALAALALGLISVVVGVIALRSAKRRAAIVALVAGIVGVVLGAVRIASSGAIGTGSGRLGAIVALVVALAGALLGAVALTRARR
jgi:hypothetical protein